MNRTQGTSRQALDSLDIVVPLYNEIEIADRLHQRLTETTQRLLARCRIIYVDDGSTDGTAQKLSEKLPWSNNVKLVLLSRNYGQASAICAGMQFADADCVAIMDGDLQDPPELICEMFDQWRAGYEVVIAQRKRRADPLFRRIAFKAFHWLFRYLSDSQIPRDTGTFCLMDQKVAEALRRLPESHRFFPGLRAWVGFRQKIVTYNRPNRVAGRPKQDFSRLFRYALDAIFSFSKKPLRVLTLAGSAICFVSVALAFWLVFKSALGWGQAPVGFTTLTCAIFGLGGFQLVGLGILGEYIGRIYDEVKGRPQYVIQREIDSPSQARDIAA